MANEEHVTLIKQGIAAWNRWREQNLAAMHPDLRDVDLNGANLRGANLVEVNLRGARLNGTDLVRANLRGADLVEADLNGAYFSEADLNGADLTSARIGFGTFGDTDLSQVKGLDQVVHQAPSTIGIDTIFRSGGNIPAAFLRGAGVPDTFITFARSLVGTPIEFYSCFISYSSKDQDFAERLYADLQNRDVRCWFAPEDLKIGDRIRDRIEQSIRVYDKLLLVLSENSIHSEWVETEVETAFERERQWTKDVPEGKTRPTVLFPVRLDDSINKTGMAWARNIHRTRHIGDFSGWKDHDAYQTAFTRLLRDLKAAD